MDNVDFSQFIPKDRGNRTIEDKIKELEECPFFMTQLPKDPTSNPQLNAIQQLAYDGTPDEIAENFKNQGNEWFKEKKFKDAVHYYGKAIESQPTNVELQSILYSNRAAAHLELENYRMAINDSRQAIALNSKNKKAFFRAAKSAFALKDVDECLRFCNCGLELDPANAQIIQIKTQCQKLKEELLLQNEKEAKRQEELRKKMATLQLELKRKHYRIVHTGEDKDLTFQHPLSGEHSVYFDTETQTLKFPVLFMYPEFKESDFIAAFDEKDRFIDHLEMMFTLENAEPLYAPWDTEKKYELHSLEIYFESWNAKEPKLFKISPQLTLGQVLKNSNYEIKNGVPHFFILKAGDSYTSSFRKMYAQQ